MARNEKERENVTKYVERFYVEFPPIGAKELLRARTQWSDTRGQAARSPWQPRKADAVFVAIEERVKRPKEHLKNAFEQSILIPVLQTWPSVQSTSLSGLMPTTQLSSPATSN